MKSPLKKPKGESDVQLARGRLRGVLNECINNQESDDADGMQGDYENYNAVLPQRGRPNKEQALRNRRQLSPIKIHFTPLKKNKLKGHRHLEATNATTISKPPETFVMKLFDRSLDLSRYTEKTPLYPICRAWMANQPRNTVIHNYQRRTPSPIKREDNGEEILEKLRNGIVTEVFEMPAPKVATIPKIPTPLVKKHPNEIKEVVEMKGSTKEELLALNMKQWKSTKQHWLKHTKQYNKRYEINYKILEELFKR